MIYEILIDDILSIFGIAGICLGVISWQKGGGTGAPEGVVEGRQLAMDSIEAHGGSE